MAYTVKKLSELSGVTVRTLHFYEEIGLLKPAYHGANGYRYYEEKELLHLQQILFYKELGFSLKQILKVVGKSDFDQLAALHSHKNALLREWEKVGLLLKTIDKTILHLTGKKKMKDEELFDGFCITLVKKAKAGASYAAAEEIVGKSVRNPTKDIENVKERGKAYYDEVNQMASALFKALVVCLEKGLDPGSRETQALIKKHHHLIDRFHNATKEVYQAAAQLYREHPEMRKQLDSFHSELGDFMASAMEVFAEAKL